MLGARQNRALDRNNLNEFKNGGRFWPPRGRRGNASLQIHLRWSPKHPRSESRSSLPSYRTPPIAISDSSQSFRTCPPPCADPFLIPSSRNPCSAAPA